MSLKQYTTNDLIAELQQLVSETPEAGEARVIYYDDEGDALDVMRVEFLDDGVAGPRVEIG